MTVAERHAATWRGDGARTVVLSHGIGGSQRQWDQVASDLARDARVLTFDLAGFGEYDMASYSPGAYETLFGYSDDLLALCSELSLSEVVYVGHSLSGMVGLLASIAQPEIFSRLVLVGASARYSDDPVTGYVGGMSEEAVQQVLDSIAGDFDAWAHGFAAYVMGEERPELATEFARSLSACEPAIALSAFKAAFGGDYREFPARVVVPATLVQSRHDPAVPDAAALWLANAIPGAALRHLDTRGHFPHVVDPAQVAREIRACAGLGS